MRIKISRAKSKDAMPLSRLECACYSIYWHPYALWVWKRAIDWWWAFKATAGKKIIGGAVLLPTRKGVFYLDTLFVAPKFRNKGIAQAILSHALKVARSKKISLDVSIRPINKPAIKIYQKAGFKRARLLKNYYKEGIDYILMERRK